MSPRTYPTVRAIVCAWCHLRSSPNTHDRLGRQGSLPLAVNYNSKGKIPGVAIAYLSSIATCYSPCSAKCFSSSATASFSSLRQSAVSPRCTMYPNLSGFPPTDKRKAMGSFASLIIFHSLILFFFFRCGRVSCAQYQSVEIRNHTFIRVAATREYDALLTVYDHVH